jgi:ABC-type phosphate/phosphonate transport system substrate-binding protein
MNASRFRLLAGVMGLAALAIWAAPARCGDSGSPVSHDGLTIVVMDPLALPLSCPCVKGYAQRDYDQLGKLIAGRLKCPVTVAFSESLNVALEKKTGGKADLVIGKDSVVRRQAKKARLPLAHIAALTGLDGKTTQTGLFIVPAKDSALSIADLKGYRIILGAEDCDEKHLAAQNLIVQSGLPRLHKAETCSACSDGATKILDLYKEGTKSATIISSYAKPLLEGCGTVKKGDLRVIGETDPVPFVAAFVNEDLPSATREALASALAEVGRDKALCKALETKAGFVVEVGAAEAKVGNAAKKNGRRLTLQ